MPEARQCTHDTKKKLRCRKRTKSGMVCWMHTDHNKRTIKVERVDTPPEKRSFFGLFSY